LKNKIKYPNKKQKASGNHSQISMGEKPKYIIAA